MNSRRTVEEGLDLVSEVLPVYQSSTKAIVFNLRNGDTLIWGKSHFKDKRSLHVSSVEFFMRGGHVETAIPFEDRWRWETKVLERLDRRSNRYNDPGLALW